MNKVIPLLLLCWSLSFVSGFSQVNYTAQDEIIPYDGPFRPGINLGYYPGWNQRELGNLAAGNPAQDVLGVGAKVVRPVLSESVLEVFGYDVAVHNFEHWKSLGMDNFTATLTQPADWHRDWTEYCPGKPSALFANLYTPIWDDGSDGTPYNDENYMAAYVYKTVSTYTEWVDFWEIWNEPGFDYSGKGWREPGDPFGNWWDNDPEPCDYILQAPIEHFVRTMRIAYEVIKTIAPEDKIIGGGFGYESFLDAILRNTDNPDGGSPTADFPLDAGAYFEIAGLHSYPHFDGTTYRGSADFRERHSDRAAEGILYQRDKFQDVYDNYGYDGNTYPTKLLLATEMNVPSSYDDSGSYFASDEGQRNFLMKAHVNAILNDVIQYHVYSLSTKPTSPYGFHTMGMYEYLEDVPIGEQVMRDGGVAMKTTSDMLWGTEYDVNQTMNLNAPNGVKAYAFRRPDNSHIYMMWAETTIDQSEFAEETFNFPNGFGFTSVDKYSWDHAITDEIENIEPIGIALTGTPIFLEGNNGTLTCTMNSYAQNIICDDQGTSDPDDDSYSFQLVVTTNTAINESYIATINGEVVTSNYTDDVILGPYLISDGPLSFNIWSQQVDGCTSFLTIIPPNACSSNPPTTGCSGNFIPNGDFEDDLSKWSIAGDAQISSNAINGTAAHITTGNSRIQQQLSISGNQSFTFSGSAKVNDGSGKAYVGVKFLSSSWEPLIRDYQRIENETYESFSFDYIAPADAAYVQVMAFTRTGSIQLWVDDLCLVEGGGNPSPDKPDLVAEYVSGTPDMFNSGNDLAIKINYSNNSDVDITQTTRMNLYLSENDQFDSSDALLLERVIDPISAMESKIINFDISQLSLAPGSYFLMAYFDPSNEIDEEIENNNIAMDFISVTDGGGPTGEVDCEAEGDFPWHDWIAGVEINGQVHNSSKRSYSDFTDVIFELSSDSNNELALRTGYSYFTHNEYFQIYIDYNKDGILANSELYYQNVLSAPADGTDEGVLNATHGPAQDFSGTTKMRVVMSRDNYNGPCGTFDFGEVEDYLVTINNQQIQTFILNNDEHDFPEFVSLTGRHHIFAPTPMNFAPETIKTIDINEVSLKVFPNPTDNVLNISWDGINGDNSKLLLVNSFGQTIWMKDINAGDWKDQQSVSSLAPGVYHLILKEDNRLVATQRIIVF